MSDDELAMFQHISRRLEGGLGISRLNVGRGMSRGFVRTRFGEDAMKTVDEEEIEYSRFQLERKFI
jgi:hypothetical protein